MLFGFLSPYTKEQQRRFLKEECERRLANVVDWDPNMKFSIELNLRASTYKTLNLFPECPVIKTGNVNMTKNPGVVSPSGRFVYAIKEMSRGSKLETWYGRKTGTVMFDGPVLIPALHENEKTTYSADQWNTDPWMSLTPAEIMTLRCGTRLARGHVVIAGLGLGHQLIEVSKRASVESITLVEKEQELVNWLMPRIKPHLKIKPTVIVGDANKVLPTIKARIALVDIFRSYGFNEFEVRCPDIERIWVWGSSKVPSRGFW